jgi:alpha-tubulin suppressor-like RCC1 family protein
MAASAFLLETSRSVVWVSLFVAADLSLACGSTSHDGAAAAEGGAPGSPSNPAVFLAIAAGRHFACGIVQGGTVQCAGDDTFGQLGEDASVGSMTPVVISGVSTATALAAGDGQVCSLLLDGTVKCWGDNGAYELGSAATDGTCSGKCSAIPQSVPGLMQVAGIFAGEESEHACALGGGGSLTCWGYAVCNPMPGIGSPPTAATGLGSATAAAAGFDFTCALLADGGVGCCGSDSHAVVSTTPSLSGVRAITASAYFACALLADGTAQCWGDGPLSNGGSSSDRVQGLAGATAITAGDSHVCALLADGTVDCWGQNTSGQLGPGTEGMTFSDSPVKVSTVTSATAIAAGGTFTCALVAGGTVQCWGGVPFSTL